MKWACVSMGLGQYSKYRHGRHTSSRSSESGREDKTFHTSEPWLVPRNKFLKWPASFTATECQVLSDTSRFGRPFGCIHLHNRDPSGRPLIFQDHSQLAGGRAAFWAWECLWGWRATRATNKWTWFLCSPASSLSPASVGITQGHVVMVTLGGADLMELKCGSGFGSTYTYKSPGWVTAWASSFLLAFTQIDLQDEQTASQEVSFFSSSFCRDKFLH